jgi:hypothetical protein
MTRSSAVAQATKTLTGATTKVQTFVLSPKTFELTTLTVAGDYKQDAKWKKLADAYHADGVTTAMLELPEKGTTSKYADLHLQIKSAIMLSFEKDTQALIAKESKTLSEIMQGTKAHWIRQIGSKYSKIQTHLLKFENIANGTAEEKKTTTPKLPKSKEGQVCYYLDFAIRVMQSMETPKQDVTKHVKTLTIVKSDFTTV